MDKFKNKKENNYAYIDGANLDKGAKSLGWKIDYKKFRIWLSEKYNISHAYIFLGFVAKYKDMYPSFQDAGFTLIFKETSYDGDGKIKGNCDADLVLKSVRDVFEKEFDKSIIVSSDGDYAGLVKFLQEKNKLRIVVSPNNKCSMLLKRTGAPILYLNDKRSTLEYIKKAPD